MSNVENLSPQIIRQIVKEMYEIHSDAPEGIKVQINETDVTDIQAVLDGPGELPCKLVKSIFRLLKAKCGRLSLLAGTPYAGGAFRVKLILGKDFPQTPPKAYFLTKIFHPNVAANGEICVNTLKKDWQPDLGLKQVLLVSGWDPVGVVSFPPKWRLILDDFVYRQ